MYSTPYSSSGAYIPSYSYRSPTAAPYYAYQSSTPTKGHNRRSSYEPSGYAYTPKRASYYAPPAYATHYATPKRADPVSGYDRLRPREAPSRYAEYDGSRQPPSMPRKQHSSKSHFVRIVYDDGVDNDDEGYFSPGPSPPPPYDMDGDFDGRGGHTDGYVRVQVPGGHPSERARPKSSRARSSSHPQPPAYTQGTPSKSRPSAAKAAATPREATPADAMAAGIPAGYSLKYWDPTEEPILLLGSVFDANTLGRWIYDWTVYHYGAATPMADLAGELWLLLIQLASKVKRAEETLPRIRYPEDRDLVDEFLESGERLWSRFGRILKVCEDYMWKVAKKDGKRTGSTKPTMGPKTGFEFVDSIFGRDRQLEHTEKLMTGMRLWSMRFDANCEDILRRPSA